MGFAFGVHLGANVERGAGSDVVHMQDMKKMHYLDIAPGSEPY